MSEVTTHSPCSDHCQLTAISALPKISGDGFVLSSSDVTNEDIEAFKQQGYTLSETCTEDGYSVFVFTGVLNAINYFYAASSEIVEDKIIPAICYRNARRSRKKWRTKTLGISEGDAGQAYVVPGTSNQKVLAQVVLQHTSERDYPDHVGLCLNVEQATFGVNGSVNGPNCRGHFVHRLVLIASPTETWRTRVDYIAAEPSTDSTTPTFIKQRTTTTNIGLSVGFKSPMNLTAGCADSEGTASGSIPTHGWSAAKTDLGCHSVMWTWELKHWMDGQPFSSSSPSKLKFGHIPDLPFPDLEHVALNKFDVQAEWKVPKDKLQGIEEIEWDVSLKLFTALVEKRDIFGYGKRKLGVLGFQVCDSLPPLISKLKHRV